MRFTKRLLSAFLAFVMVFTMLPLQAYASEGGIEDKHESANFGGFVNPASETRLAEKIQIPVGGEAQISNPKYIGTWEVEQKDKFIDSSVDAWGNLDIEGLKPGTATVKYVGSFAGTTHIYTVEVTENGSKNTFTVNPTVSNASVAYATNIGRRWSDIQPVTGGQLVFENFASSKTMGYVVFFVKGTSNHLITGLNADGAGNIYPIGGGYGAITGYPSISTIANKAAAQGYQACFGYSKSKGDLPQELGFTVAGQRPEMTMSAEVDKTSDVIPGDKLKFTVTIRPDQELAGKRLSITNLQLTSLQINDKDVQHGNPEKQRDGSYVVKVDYTATEEACLHGKIQLTASASVSYAYSLQADQATVTTRATVTASAKAECAIGAREGVNYFYQYDAPEGVQAHGIPAAPADNNFYYKGSNVTVKEYPESPVMDDVNDGIWTFDGWYLDGKKYTAGETAKMQSERLNFSGVWTFAYTPHNVNFTYKNAPAGTQKPEAKQDLHKGEIFDLPEAAKLAGYQFDGWKLEDKLEDKCYQPGDRFTMPNKDVTFIGSYSVPDSQKYAVKVNVYLGNGNKAQLLETKTKENITWKQLTDYYGMSHYEVANALWGNQIFDQNSDLITSQWKTKQDAGLTFPDKYHVLDLHLREGSPALVTLTYDANGGTGEPGAVTVLKNTEVTVSSTEPTRENYTFTGWNTAANGSGTSYSANETITLTEDTTLFAQWTANTAGYAVEYWFQVVTGDGYSQKLKEYPDATFEGTTRAQTDAQPLAETPEGFHHNADKTVNVEITADGKAVAKVYYDRNVHNVVYKITGEYFANANYRTDEGIRFGAKLPAAPENMDKAGYVWSGWSKLPETMPDRDVVVTGSYSLQTGLPYTVKYIWNGEILNTVHGTGTFGDPIDPEVKDFEGYTFKDKQSGVTITADETQNVVNVYYYKNVTLTANSDNNRIYNGEPQSLSGYTASVEGLTFEGVEEPTATATNAGEYPLTFADGTKGKTDSTDKYIVTEVTDGKLTIKPKAVTLRTEGASKDYDGEPLTKPGVNGADGFVAADVEQVEATGTQTLVGKSDNTIEIVWTDDALAKNYTITEDLGTLTVTAPKDFDYVQKNHQEGNYTVGQKVKFTITVTNIYDVPATVVLKEQVGMTFADGKTTLTDEIPAGETRTYTVSHEVTDKEVEAGEIKNVVTWTLTPNGVPPISGEDEEIIKNPKYKVSYSVSGEIPEGYIPPVAAEYPIGKSVAVAAVPSYPGYTFTGWTAPAGITVTEDKFVMPEKNVELTGVFALAGDIAYKVEHYFAGLDGKYPVTPNKTEPKTGTTLADTKAQPIPENQRPGFGVVDGWANEKIQPNGSTVIRIYYEREVYNISWQTSGEPVDQEQTFETRSFLYGADISKVENPVVKQFDGYTWNGWEIQNEKMPTLPEKMPAEDILITGSYTPIDYTVTYELAEDSEIPANYTAPVDTNKYHIGSTVTVKADERVPGYDFEGWYTEDGEVTEAMSTFTMPADNVTMYGKFTFATDTKYTVEHYFENLGGGYPAEPNHTESKVGTTSQLTEAMPIPAGSITGFTVDGSWKQQTIKPDGSTVVKIYYTRNSYNLTVHYRNVGGAAVADSYHGTYKFGETWKIVSPIVAGYYDPQIRSISSGANGMPAQDLEYVVTYTAIPVPAPDPGPAPNPGPDDGDDDDDTPPAPVEPEEPGDYEVDPDDYTLTEVEDNETPLANLNLEGHTCCILHLLLMLAAMVVLGFDTKSRKKHQARIFELKKMLAMEEDHSDDPEQP